MNTFNLKCPCCSANMTLDTTHEYAVCEYCGHQIVLEKKEKHVIKKEHLGFVVFLTIFLLLGTLGLAMTFYSKPLLEDPFVYLEVTFEGIDGDGELSMKVNNNAPDGIDMANVSFQSKSKTNLREGDMIVIEAISTEYRLKTSTKRYTVEGLERYLKDVQSLDEKQLDTIFGANESIQFYNVELVLEDEENLQIKPCRLICYNNKTENELYLISEVCFTVSDKKYYTVSEWEDVIVNSANGNLALSSGSYRGNLTIVKSWRSAMLYGTFEEAVRKVEGEQSAQEESSIRDFE